MKREFKMLGVLCLLGLMIFGCGGGGGGNDSELSPDTDRSGMTETGDYYLPLAIGNKWVYDVQEKVFSGTSDEPKECSIFTYTVEITSGYGNNWIAEYNKTGADGNIVEEGSIYLDKKDGQYLKDSLILIPTEKNQQLVGGTATGMFYELGNDLFKTGMAEYSFNENMVTLNFSSAYTTTIMSATTSGWKEVNEIYRKGIGLYEFYKEQGAGVYVSGGPFPIATYSNTETKGKLRDYVINGNYHEVETETTEELYETAESSRILLENVQNALDTMLAYCKLTDDSLYQSDLDAILQSDLIINFSEEDQTRLQKLHSDFETFDSNADGELSEEEISIALSIPSEIYIAEKFEQAKSADELIKNAGASLTGEYKFVNLIPIEIYRIVNTSLLTLFDETDQSRLRNLSDNFETFDTDGDGALYPEEVGNALSIPTE